LEWPRFNASRYKVSNGEFLEFVKDGGYHSADHWSAEGWGWRVFRNAKWPTFWTSVGPAGKHDYRLRTNFEVQPMPWSWPAEVNFHEARAYCNWRSARDETPYKMQTEAQSWRLRGDQTTATGGCVAAVTDPVMESPGNKIASKHGVNLNLAYSTPWPVDSSHGGVNGAFGDVMGSVWEWCEEMFYPLTGFEVSPLYDDFSAPCFDGQHRMIVGGGYISTGDMASVWARFHFREHFHQSAGFRLASCAPSTTVSSAATATAATTAADTAATSATTTGAASLSMDSRGMSYESDTLLHEYLLLHFGAEADTLPFRSSSKPVGPRDAIRFPQRCGELVSEWAQRLQLPTLSALDIGCAVGGSTFELAKTFDRVVGVDRSEAFVSAAKSMSVKGRQRFWCRDQGTLGDWRVATLEPGSEETASSAEFAVADACALPDDLAGFNAVLMANLLCRLPDPQACLAQLSGPQAIVKPGGLAVIISPYTWMTEHTPPERWLGGYEGSGGERMYSNATLAGLLTDYTLLHEEEMPLLIREHKRKYQYIITHAMVFQRHSK